MKKYIFEEPISLANAAVSIMGRRKGLAFSDGNASKHNSDSNDSKTGENEHGGFYKKKWKSGWDLTETQRKKKRKRKPKTMEINPMSHFSLEDSQQYVYSLKEKAQLENIDRPAIDSMSSLILPPLPTNGKRMIDTIIDMDVDSAYKSAFENQTFFEIVTAKTYGEINNYSVSNWLKTEAGQMRNMHYEFPKTIAYTRHKMVVDQIQTKCKWSKQGIGYGIDSVVRTTGVLYSDYFYLEIHTRFEKSAESKTRLIVIADTIWEKPCLLKSRIETETMSGTKKYYEVFEKELHSEKTCTTKLLESDHIFPKESKAKPFNQLEDDVGSKEMMDIRKTLSFKKDHIFLAFILIILVLLVITFAMLRLAGSLAVLSERLQVLENLLGQYAHKCLVNKS